jgi:hypothetical protein
MEHERDGAENHRQLLINEDEGKGHFPEYK